MNLFRQLLKLSGTGFTKGQYYESMNIALKRLNNGYTMLHYPLFVSENDSFTRAQENLTNYCIGLLEPLADKEVIEIGCGNGVQSLYIYNNFRPAQIIGVDLSRNNIRIALSEKERLNVKGVDFIIDDAQDLKNIPSESADVILNIESAFHYPDKAAFIREIHRVLKPGGEFLVADILSTGKKKRSIMNLWGKSMSHNFWDQERYDQEFACSDLQIKESEDISHLVRKGWSMYRNWLPEIKRKSFIRNLAFRIFYVINVRINIYLLRKQQYQVYTGYKRAA